MTLDLPVDEVYIDMLAQIEEERGGDAHADLARMVESAIHENYQALHEQRATPPG